MSVSVVAFGTDTRGVSPGTLLALSASLTSTARPVLGIAVVLGV